MQRLRKSAHAVFTNNESYFTPRIGVSRYVGRVIINPTPKSPFLWTFITYR